MKIEWLDFSLDFTKKTYIMGILNVTPDSFSDGGSFFDKNTAVKRAVQMVEDGADIIDIGGESTRPGAEPVELEEEIRRTIPVIELIAKKINIPVSIDTYKSEVARRAVDAGASIINDISGLRYDKKMSEIAAKQNIPVVIMHMKGRPKDMQQAPSYEALIPEIMDYFRQSIDIALKSGIPQDKIIIDPGIGFGKNFDHNLEIINRLSEFRLLGKPLLIGHSRKAFIGEILDNAPVSQRLYGTAAVAAISILNGANIIRAHDVKEMADVVKVADAVLREKINQ
ncbi:MAG: dihydropteroate synthase [Nitrospiraceae bacterium]|nr:dihydropteroate synthase [Nitrospiraceae bacterium]